LEVEADEEEEFGFGEGAETIQQEPLSAMRKEAVEE
jgi:hypothetical protein